MSVENALNIVFQAAEVGAAVMEAQETQAQASAEARAARANAATAEANAAIERANAEAARRKAAYDANLKREENAKLSSRQRALYAKAGIELDVGTPLLVLAEQARDMEESARNIELQGEVDYTTGVSKANIWKNTATNFMRSAREVESVGNLGAASGILKSVNKMFNA